MAVDYRLAIINNQIKLENLVEEIDSIPVIALDIETIEWWNRQREQIALIQLAFRQQEQLKVAVIDPLTKINLELLRAVLISDSTLKVIHNAAFDANKLAKFYHMEVSPIFDTMVAARRNGEKKYSLQSQAFTHLNLHLDKGSQRSDWSRRPLNLRQLDYAALDAVVALLLYEHQKQRNLHGGYHLPLPVSANQLAFGFEELDDQINSFDDRDKLQENRNAVTAIVSDAELPPSFLALLGVISELAGRYGPEQLAVSVDTDRVGLAGWIIDKKIGSETEIDEASARLIIGELSERKLIKLTDTGRLEATETGSHLWKSLKTDY